MQITPCMRLKKAAEMASDLVSKLHVYNALIEHHGRRIINIIINGESLKEEKWYSVASSEEEIKKG